MPTRHALEGEVQRRPEARWAQGLLGGDRDAADPQSLQPLLAGNVRDSDQQGTEDPLTTVLVDRGAVPDVTLARPRSDLELRLADPLRARREPPVTAEGAIDPDREAAASPGETGGDEVAVGAHGRDEW